MSTQPNPPSAASPPAAKSRSRVEKFIVRGGIMLLILLAAVQAHARFGYSWTLQRLQARLANDETDGKSVAISELPQLVVGWPSRTEKRDGKWGLVVYSWRGLTDTYQIRMPYDSSDTPPAVLELVTADPPPLPTYDASPAETQEAESPMAGMGGRMGGGMGGGMSGPGAHVGPGGGPGGNPAAGGGGGGPRPDIMASDADGDGKVSLEEAPERMKQFFDRIDENKDGFIDEDEAAAARRRREERAAAGGSGADGRPRSAESQPTPSDASEKPEAAEKPASSTEKPAEASSPANVTP